MPTFLVENDKYYSKEIGVGSNTIILLKTSYP